MAAKITRHAVRFFTALAICLGSGFLAPTWAQDKVTLRLDFSACCGYHAPFFVAKELGYYKDAGLDVTILEGKGSASTIQLVANGADTFGFADASVAANLVSKGAPVKVVMGLVRRSALTVVFPVSGGIRTPADLKGRTIAVTPGTGTSEFMVAFLKALNIKPEEVKFANVELSARYSLLGQKQVDATVSYGPSAGPLLERVGIKEWGRFDFADAGVVLPQHGIIAAQSTIDTKPDMVKRFVAATAKGWLQAKKDPTAAVESLVRGFPLLKGSESALKVDLTEYLTRFSDTSATAGKPFGWQSPEDWMKAEKLLAEYMGLKPQGIDKYFTNEFISQ